MKAKKGEKWTFGIVIIGFSVLAALNIVAAVIAIANLSSPNHVAALAFLFGTAMILAGYFHLVYLLPRMAKDIETRVSIEALRVSYWLVMFGIVMIVLGLLHLMGVLPPSV